MIRRQALCNLLVLLMSPALGARVSRAGAQRTIHIDISAFVYLPASTSVSPGDRVVFTNHDIVPHTATAIDGSWDTGELARGEQAEVTIVDPMTEQYYCLYHPHMKGTLARRT